MCLVTNNFNILYSHYTGRWVIHRDKKGIKFLTFKILIFVNWNSNRQFLSLIRLSAPVIEYSLQGLITLVIRNYDLKFILYSSWYLYTKVI